MLFTRWILPCPSCGGARFINKTPQWEQDHLSLLRNWKSSAFCLYPHRQEEEESSAVYKPLPSERRLRVPKCKSNSLKLSFVPAFYQAAELLARQQEHKLLTLAVFFVKHPAINVKCRRIQRKVSHPLRCVYMKQPSGFSCFFRCF